MSRWTQPPLRLLEKKQKQKQKQKTNKKEKTLENPKFIVVMIWIHSRIFLKPRAGGSHIDMENEYVPSVWVLLFPKNLAFGIFIRDVGAII